MDTKDGWSERKRLLYDARVASLCELQRLQKITGKSSLGMIRVGKVTGFRTVEADEKKFCAADELHEHAASPDLFNEHKNRVEPLPFKFLYAFNCTDRDCRGHNCQILDWEAYARFTVAWFGSTERRKPSRRCGRCTSISSAHSIRRRTSTWVT